MIKFSPMICCSWILLPFFLLKPAEALRVLAFVGKRHWKSRKSLLLDMNVFVFKCHLSEPNTNMKTANVAILRWGVVRQAPG